MFEHGRILNSTVQALDAIPALVGAIVCFLIRALVIKFKLNAPYSRAKPGTRPTKTSTD